MALAGGDAVDIYPWWVSLSLSSVHAETGVSQVQILPARPSSFHQNKLNKCLFLTNNPEIGFFRLSKKHKWRTFYFTV